MGEFGGGRGVYYPRLFEARGFYGASSLSDAYSMSDLQQELTRLGQCFVEISLSVCNLRLVHFYCPG